MSDWKPKVGEKCLVKQGGAWHETFIVGISSSGSYVYESIEFSDSTYDGNINIACFKPLPTEEEKLIDEFIKDYSYIAYPADCDFKEMAECIARTMIRKGYRKVEPISAEKLSDIKYLRSRESMLNYLVDNNHIVVKGE